MAAACCLWPSNAAASSVASLIEWDAPESCGGALEVYARLSAVLGDEPEQLGKLSRVRGTIVRSDAGYRLTLEAFERGRRSTRLFEAASCEQLIDASALAIALAMAPEGAAPAQPGVDSEVALARISGGGDAQRVDGASLEEDVQPAAVEPSEASPVAGVASVAAVMEYGALPRVAAGLAVGGGARMGGLSLGGYGVLFGSEQLRVAPNQNVEFELLLAGGRVCYVVFEDGPRFNACASFEAGQLGARGVALSSARQAQDLWLAAGAGVEAEWPLGAALGIVVRAEPMFALVRKQYTVNGTEGVHAPAPLSSRGYLGLVLTSD